MTSVENKKPIGSQGILRLPNERTEKFRISKIKRSSRFYVKFISVHCWYRYQSIGIMGIQHKMSQLWLVLNLIKKIIYPVFFVFWWYLGLNKNLLIWGQTLTIQRFWDYIGLKFQKRTASNTLNETQYAFQFSIKIERTKNL